MLDKIFTGIKGVFTAVQDNLKIIGMAFVTALMVVIEILLQQNRKLRDKWQEEKDKNQLGEMKHDLEQVDKTASDAVSNYERTKSNYTGGGSTK